MLPTQRQPGVTTFLRLWIVLGVSYFFVNLILDLLVFGWVDLRPRALWELLFLPLAQSVLFWWVSRRGRARLAATPVAQEGAQ